MLTLFLFQKGQGFFPPLPIAALLPRSRRGAGLPLAGWDASVWLGEFCSLDEWTDFLCPVGGGQAYPLQGEMFQCSSYFFATQKVSVNLISRWPFLQAMRPVAEWRFILYNRQEAAPDRRAVAPVVPRR